MASAIMTVREVAEYLNEHPETIRIRARRGELPAFKHGNGPRAQYRFRRASLEAEIARREAAQARGVRA